MMKFSLVLMETGPAPTDLKTTVVCAHESREAIDAFIERGKAAPSVPGGFLAVSAGRKGKPVMVVGVAPDVSGFSVGDIFPSAQAASHALRGAGSTSIYNVVAKRLEGVRGLEPAERIVEIYGVSLQYVEDLRAEQLASLRD